MHLYSILLCIAVHPKHFTIMWWGGGGVSPQTPPVCSIHLEQTQRQPDFPTRVLLLLFKIVWYGGLSGNDSLDVPFPSMIRLSLTAAMRDGQQRQVKVDTVVSCFIRINLQNWHSCVETAVGFGFTVCKYMIVRTICLNKALFHVSLTCIYLLS